MYECSAVEVQTLCNPMDCSLPGSSDLGILQARILKWVIMPSSGDLPEPVIAPAFLMFPALAGGSLPLAPPRKSLKIHKSREIKDCRLLGQTPKKDVLFIIGDWNAKVGIQEIPGLFLSGLLHSV